MSNTPTPKSRFETQGQVAAPVNVSGAPSPHTALVPKRSNGTGMLEGATASIRPNVLEPQGAPGGIKARYNPYNSPEASQNTRNTYVVRSALGNRDFWDARASAQV